MPTAAYFWWSNEDSGTNKTLNTSEERMIITKNSSSELSSSKKAESEVESEVSSESSQEESSEPESEATEIKEPESPAAEEPEEPVVEPEPESESEVVEDTTNTYTVQAGDNLYRIALNHNMTTDELKSLNGISGDSVSVGTVLKVN